MSVGGTFMPINYHEESKTFHLYNKQISYIFKILENNQLGQLYFGKRIEDTNSYDYLLEVIRRPMAAYKNLGESLFSMEHIKQEYPVYGSGDTRLPAIEIEQENGSKLSDFEYKSYTITQGKKDIKHLPHTYATDSESTSLSIECTDKVTGVTLYLNYTIFENYSVIARSVKVVNHGNQNLKLNQAMSMSLDLPDKDYEMMMFTGAWSRERFPSCQPLHYGIQAIESLRGNSSHQFNPFFILKRPDCNEHHGDAFGFHILYSGNFLAQIEVDTYDVSRITYGIHPHTFQWNLAPEDEFQTPEAVMFFSDQGLNGLSQSIHSLFNKHLVKGIYKEKVRPILINNWEATYWDFKEDKILEIASKAKELGIELFVLDDGWFGKRDHDLAGLGDWYTNLKKLPDGLDGLSKKIHAMGLQFGIWIEPEMVNKDSDLYRNHPDWVLQTPERILHHSRNQYVLDFANYDVIDYIFDMLVKAFDHANIDYIKWDMNRSMSDVHSSYYPNNQQGEITHRYILGVYELYERLIERYPNILFESCASGGGRYDAGMLAYAPQCWTSDNTDGVERIKIQYGTSYGYPISSMGAHVSAIPNHQMHRKTPLSLRANIAYFGTFGYELDLAQLSDYEIEEMKQQIIFMKEYREVIQFGKYYRLLSPFAGNESAWMVVSQDQETAIVCYSRILQEVNTHYRRLPLHGLNPQLQYEIEHDSYTHYGSELMNAGLVISDESSGEIQGVPNDSTGDYQSRLYILKMHP